MAFDIQEIESNAFSGDIVKDGSGGNTLQKKQVTVKYLILNDSAGSTAPIAAEQFFADFALQQTYNGLNPQKIHFEEVPEAAGETYKGEITFGTDDELPDDGSGGDGSDFDELPNEYSFTAEPSFVDVPFVRDVRTGQPIVNSAGQPFNPPLMRQELLLSLTVSYKQHTAPPIALSGTVNQAPFLGAPAGTVLLESVSGSKGETDKKWSVSRKYTFKPSGWATYVLDTGTMERTANGLRAILDAESHAVQEPVKLDGNGHAAPNSAGVLLGPFWGYN